MDRYPDLADSILRLIKATLISDYASQFDGEPDLDEGRRLVVAFFSVRSKAARGTLIACAEALIERSGPDENASLTLGEACRFRARPARAA